MTIKLNGGPSNSTQATSEDSGDDVDQDRPNEDVENRGSEHASDDGDSGQNDDSKDKRSGEEEQFEEDSGQQSRQNRRENTASGNEDHVGEQSLNNRRVDNDSGDDGSADDESAGTHLRRSPRNRANKGTAKAPTRVASRLKRMPSEKAKVRIGEANNAGEESSVTKKKSQAPQLPAQSGTKGKTHVPHDQHSGMDYARYANKFGSLTQHQDTVGDANEGEGEDEDEDQVDQRLLKKQRKKEAKRRARAAAATQNGRKET